MLVHDLLRLLEFNISVARVEAELLVEVVAEGLSVDGFELLDLDGASVVFGAILESDVVNAGDTLLKTDINVGVDPCDLVASGHVVAGVPLGGLKEEGVFDKVGGQGVGVDPEVEGEPFSGEVELLSTTNGKLGVLDESELAGLFVPLDGDGSFEKNVEFKVDTDLHVFGVADADVLFPGAKTEFLVGGVGERLDHGLVLETSSGGS